MSGKWARFEEEKRKIAEKKLSCKEYEDEIRKLSKKYKI